MRAMRAETFIGYEALKLVELPKPAVVGRESSGANHRGWRHAARLHDSLRQLSPLESAASPRQRRSGRRRGGRRNGLSRRFTRHVLRRLWRF